MVMNLPDAVDKFLLEQQLRGNTEKTIQGYRGYLRRFTAYLSASGVTELQYMTIDHIHNYQLYINNKPNERGRGDKLARRSVQTYVRHIKVFVGYCYEQNFVTVDLRPKIRIPKAERPVIEILTDEEVDNILSHFQQTEMGLRNRAIICLMLDCGLRRGEITSIRREDMNFDKRYVMVMGKGRRGRIVPLGKAMCEALRDYLCVRRQAVGLDSDEYVFITCNRTPIKNNTLGLLMRRLKQKTGIKRLRAHLLRHTFATNYLLHGLGDVYELSRLLGHSDIKMTEKYLQLASYYEIMERRERVT
jgi:integrase/recombinase XerC/integrase/recombinase XerD